MLHRFHMTFCRESIFFYTYIAHTTVVKLKHVTFCVHNNMLELTTPYMKLMPQQECDVKNLDASKQATHLQFFLILMFP